MQVESIHNKKPVKTIVERVGGENNDIKIRIIKGDSIIRKVDFEKKVQGKIVGKASLNWIQDKKHFTLDRIDIDPAYQGEGHGSSIMQEINKILIENNAVGVLVNDIKGDEKSREFYAKNGWKPMLDGSDSLMKFAA